MGFEDTFKGLVDKGKKLVTEHADKIEDAVDKAGDFVDEKTGGKYAEHVDKVQDAAKKAIPDNGPIDQVKDAAADVKDATDGK